LSQALGTIRTAQTTMKLTFILPSLTESLSAGTQVKLGFSEEKVRNEG
jgi:hypothetical protein